MLQPENLEPLTTHRGYTKEKTASSKKKTVEYDGDVRMKADFGTYSIVFAEENQDSSHLAMPLRCMNYDVEEYREQWFKMKSAHEQAKDLDPGTEFLSGLKKGEKFTPVVSTVLFSGKTWEGPLDLYDMLDLYLADHREELETIGTIAEDALIAILGESARITTENIEGNNKGESRLCKAIDEMLEETRLEGIHKGKLEGRLEGKLEGENKFAQLAQILASNSRVEDLLKATSDYDYRNLLYNKHKIE